MKVFLVFSIIVIALTGCQEESKPSQSSETVEQTTALLVSSGNYPALDKSDSLEGPDKDGDGIRDDISEYIDTLPESDVQKRQVKKVAKSIQASIVADTENIAAIEVIDRSATMQIGCLAIVYDNPADAHKILKQIEHYTANTKKRALAYAAYNQALDGTVTRLPQVLECEEAAE